MTDPQRVVIARLSTEFVALSQQLMRVSADLGELDRLLAAGPQQAPAPQYVLPAPPHQPYYYGPPHPTPQAPPPPYLPPPAPVPPAAATPAAPRPPRSEGWIGKVLAVAGVGVTLIGVVLLLVLAAQAGILRPEFRVAAGAVLAGVLVAAAGRLWARPGGRVGAIALAATGVAAAYIDLIAVTTIYAWVSAPVGLILGAGIAGGGLMLARRWSSERLALLVLVPLVGLAPVVTDGITLLLVGFMLALSVASLPVQLGRDWTWLFAARTAAPTLPLLVALAAAGIGSEHDLWLAAAGGIAALLALGGAILVLPGTTNRTAVALCAAAGTLPVLCVPLAVDRVLAALMIGTLAAILLAVVALGDRLAGVPGAVRQIWSALSAIAALLAVNVAFDGEVAAPLLLAAAVVVAVAGRGDRVARWAAVGWAGTGGVLFLAYAPPAMLVSATATSTPDAVSILTASVLLVAATAAIARAWAGHDGGDADAVRLLWVGAAAVAVYAVTTFTVTAGVLVGGTGGGFLAGHMAATICWIAMAAALFRYAAHRERAERSLPIGGGLGLVAAAMSKLFLFDLGTLDGMFRVGVFIVTGLALLAMATGYARQLAQQDQQQGV
jgi:hypothetical protein